MRRVDKGATSKINQTVYRDENCRGCEPSTSMRLLDFVDEFCACKFEVEMETSERMLGNLRFGIVIQALEKVVLREQSALHCELCDTCIAFRVEVDRTSTSIDVGLWTHGHRSDNLSERKCACCNQHGHDV